MKGKITATSATSQMEQMVTLMDLLFTEIEVAFKKHRLSLKYKQTSEDVTKKLRRTLVELQQALVHVTGEEALVVQSAALNLSKIFYNLLRLSHAVEMKVTKKILFSSVAADELTEIIIRTRLLLPHLADALRTCNAIITDHVQKEATELRSLAESNTQKHDERACLGKCHPDAAFIYLQMLSHLQDILWHYQALVCESGIPLV